MIPCAILLFGLLGPLTAQEPSRDESPAVQVETPPPASVPQAPPPASQEPAQAAGPSWSGIAGLVAFVLLLVGGVVYLIHAMEQAIFNKARAVARELGCSDPPYRTKTMSEDYEVHQWVYDGVPVTLHAGSKIAAINGAGVGAVPVMGYVIAAELPKKLPFQLTIAKPGVVAGHAVSSGDAAFDQELAAVSSDDQAARRLLEDNGLRRALRDLFQSGASLPTVLGTLSEKQVQLQTSDRKNLRENLLVAASLAKSVSNKAEKLGLLAPRTAAAAPGLPAVDPASPVLVLPDVSTRFPSWTARGPCVLRQEGIYFFLKSLAFVKDAEGVFELMGESLGQGGALLGALGAAAGAALDRQLQARTGRPSGVYFGSARDVSERLGAALQEAPAIVDCREFFVVPRTAVQKVSLGESGDLAVMTAEQTFVLSGLPDREKVKGFLSFRGYPVTSQP